MENARISGTLHLCQLIIEEIVIKHRALCFHWPWTRLMFQQWSSDTALSLHSATATRKQTRLGVSAPLGTPLVKPRARRSGVIAS